MNLTPMVNWSLFGIGCFLTYQGYYYGKRKLEEYIMKRVLDELNIRMRNEEEEELFKPIHSNSAVIKVNSGGKTHSVYVPYNRKKSTAMIRKRVYLLKGTEKIDISQKPGVEYMITAKDLGGEKIVIENMEGEIIKVYDEDEIPNFF